MTDRITQLEERIKTVDKFFLPINIQQDGCYTISISDSTYPVIINDDIGHVDDFTYSNEFEGYPLLRKGDKLYLEVGLEFLKCYVDTDKMDSDFNVTSMTLEEALSKEIKYGNVCLDV